jgi:hypothetical protein
MDNHKIVEVILLFIILFYYYPLLSYIILRYSSQIKHINKYYALVIL